jgi:hypothetical protein
MSTIPDELNFNSIPPLLITMSSKLVQINPLGSFNNVFQLSEMIKFQFYGNTQKTGKKEYLDIMSSFIELNMSFSTLPGGPLVADAVFTNKNMTLESSAQSHFQTTILTNQDGTELNRINNYWALADRLKAVHFSPRDRQMHHHEGYGGFITDDLSKITSRVNTQANIHEAVVGAVDLINIGGDGQINPAYLIGGAYPNDGTNHWNNATFWSPLIDNYHPWQAKGMSSAPTADPPTQWWTTEWSMGPTQGGACPRNMIACSQMQGPQTWYASVLADEANANGAGLFPAPYTAAIPGYLGVTYPQTAGMEQPFPPQTSSSGFEPIFSIDNTQRVVAQGIVQNISVTSTTYAIPVLDPIIGRLSPEAYAKFLPMKALNGCTYQLQPNSNAYRSSYWSTNQGNRAYQINAITFYCELLTIDDPEIAAAIDASVDRGFQMLTEAWYNTPSIMITPGGGIQGSYQFNTGFKSLNKVFHCFNVLDWTKNTNCRQTNWVSMCLTQLQWRFLNDYYPPLALMGNGGTVFGQGNGNGVNNEEFYVQTMRAFGKNYHPGGVTLNPMNFAINMAELDPTSADPNLTGNNQLGDFLNHRMKGECIYAYDFRGLDKDKGTLSGIDCSDGRLIEVLMQSDTTYPFPRAVNLMSFWNYSMTVTYQNGLLMTAGMA